MSKNLTKEKREKLFDKINEIKKFIGTYCKCSDSVKYLTYLDELIYELKNKKYGLVFEEHEEEIDGILSSNIPVLQEEKDLFIDNGGETNLLLEGDNLAALQLLQKTYENKIDIIYIDPPYNTGKNNFLYNDNYSDSDDFFKHSKWLSFMKKRLDLAKTLMADDGVIFVSIDESEQACLKLLLDDIFGEKNRLSTHHIKVRYSNKSLNARQDFQECFEYVFIYCKKKFSANRIKENYSIDKFKYSIEEMNKGEILKYNDKVIEIFRKDEWQLSKIKPDVNGLKETWISGSIYSDTGHGFIYRNIVEPRFNIDGCGCLYKIYGLGEDGLGYRYFTNPKKENGTRGKMFTGIPAIVKNNLASGSADSFKTIPNFYDFSAEFGNISKEGGVKFNRGKKPVNMLKQFINYHKGKDITVLDFFAGSGSTAQAVLSLNKDDGGHRKFILCTNNENNICRDITYERLKNLFTKYKYPGSLKYFTISFISSNENNKGNT